MIPYEIDPSLHTAAPEPESLDDGFSPRPPNEESTAQLPLFPVAETLAEKSDF